MADLYTDVACRVFACEDVLDYILYLVKRSTGVVFSAEREVNASVSQLVERVHTRLDVCDFVFENEFRRCCKRSCREC